MLLFFSVMLEVFHTNQIYNLKTYILIIGGISHISANSGRGHKTWGSVTGTLQQIVPGKVPEGI